MADILIGYGSSGQTLTCAINSLASDTSGAITGRESTVVDNSTTKYLDALVSPTIAANSSGVSATGYVDLYAYGSVDGGSNYSDGAAGSDGSLTLTDPPNMRLLGRVNVVANSGTYKGGPFSVASCFGGVLPERWGVFVHNASGAALSGSGNSIKWQGIKGTTA